MPDAPLINDQKADFSSIYDRPDPREYFSTLSALDYQIPQRALPVFDAVLNALPGRARGSTVVDVCCSYGINAALLRHGVNMADLYAHYTSPVVLAASPGELLAADRKFFAQRRRRSDVVVAGLDAAQPAIDYAVGAGLLAEGWAENLETTDPSPDLARGIGEADLIISTGGVGYIGGPTFDRLLSAVDDPQHLWLAIFVLRVFDYSKIADVLAGYGLVTEKLPGVTFPQRRFASRDEQQAAIHDVKGRGLDPEGKEADGWFHADCFLSRPAAAAAQVPITSLLGSR
ncbi:MAG TPA: class I SAM-dependent methyltransferase [Streptosporangiaceae bacterium]|jgi:hypothetical protein